MLSHGLELPGEGRWRPCALHGHLAAHEVQSRHYADFPVQPSFHVGTVVLQGRGLTDDLLSVLAYCYVTGGD